MSKSKPALVLASVLLFSATASSQCASLKTTGGSAGTTMTISVRGGAVKSPVILFWGFRDGSTTLPLGGLGNLTLGLRIPFLPVFLGEASLLGALDVQMNVPRFIPKISVKAQAVTFGLKIAWPPRTGWCTSNVATVTFGG